MNRPVNSVRMSADGLERPAFTHRLFPTKMKTSPVSTIARTQADIASTGPRP